MGRPRNRGLWAHRLRSNPLEKAFAKMWDDYQAGQNLEYLLTEGDQHFPTPVSKRDRLVAATLIQWLGSEVGQNFLKDVETGKKTLNLGPSKNEKRLSAQKTADKVREEDRRKAWAVWNSARLKSQRKAEADVSKAVSQASVVRDADLRAAENKYWQTMRAIDVKFQRQK